MKKIIVIGSPGSGKSTLAKRLAKITGFPLLHIDRIYHIDNYNHISRDELLDRITNFITGKEAFIIDGNYSNTLSYRLEVADTVILFDLDTDICLDNVIHRVEGGLPRDDIAPGFDNSILDADFVEYVRSFRQERLPRIEALLAEYPVAVIRIQSHADADLFLANLEILVHSDLD